MAHRPRRGAVALLGGLLLALTAAPFPAIAAAPAAAPPADGSGMVMVLDSSGSMAGSDGSGSTRIAAARKAVGTVADALPAGYPVGLRVYGADKPKGCDDTRLAQPVAPLDRAGLKRAVAGVRPKGDTPIGLSLRKAAEDLPAPAGGATGKRTILLISDGEDNCQAPSPCKVAAQLAASGVDLRIDAIGFQVAGKARTQLECLAKAGNGRYYDAPDAASLARQLQRAGQLSVDGYRFKGRRIHGTADGGGAPSMGPGQYLDSIGPNEERYYAVGLDAVSTADFSATVVPQPGATVGLLDRLRTRIAYGTDGTCESDTGMFGQTEGATPLTSSVSRVPSQSGYGSCDKAGRYWLVVERRAAKGSDATRWPMELTFHVEHPLKKGVTPAQSAPEYGAGGKDATLPTTAPRDTTGGTGFNDARALRPGVWRDKVLPAQTLWYKVRVGWGQQLRYDVEFANEPTVKGHSSTTSYGGTQVYTPFRTPVGSGTGLFDPHVPYDGRLTSLSMGTVPVAWTNRYEGHPDVIPVHDKGDFYIAVTLGAKASEIAQHPQIGVVLRVAVLGKEKSGPEAGAATSTSAIAAGESGPSPDGAQGGSGGWSTGRVVALAVGGVGVLLLAGLVLAYVRARRKPVA
ncbi:vWA domain-containing protein [Streptomyces lydicus]|uniref:vWA domain-containing protein n=1 Tax=Streptomyces lydicus TaxID=47763 RepID=UPI00068FBEEF|nr:VWA domain-containing protein [Streptomyces lydicus]MDC7337996.1 VWA domain-containing protein [Streptomyces lydicus]UEG92594.1 VWA domain-containing protein [Streptomyces lydicus]